MPMEPPSLHLQIGMRYENTQSRDKKRSNENSMFFKMHKSNSLYNETEQNFHKWLLLYIDTAFKKCSPYSSLSLLFILERCHVCLWAGLFTPWAQSSVSQAMRKILAHDVLQYGLLVLRLFLGLDMHVKTSWFLLHNLLQVRYHNRLPQHHSRSWRHSQIFSLCC